MSYRAIVENNGIPLSLHIPKETAKVLETAKKGKYTKVKSFTELLTSAEK